MCDVLAKPVWDECRHLVEADLVRLKLDLAPLEAGQIQVGECLSGGSWVDVTRGAMQSQRRMIATLEAVLAVIDGA